MAERDVVILNESANELQEIQSGDTHRMQADLSLSNNQITAVERIDIEGVSASYTADPGNFIDISQDHEWDYAGGFASLGRAISVAVRFAGTHTITGGNGNPFGMGALFSAQQTITNNAGEANNLTSFYTLLDNPSWRANAQTITLTIHNGFRSAPTFGVTESSPIGSPMASLTVANCVGVFSRPTVETGATVTQNWGFHAGGLDVQSGGAATRDCGFSHKVTDADVANSTAFAIGYTTSDTLPTGDYGVYQGNGDERPSKWNGGQAYKVNTQSGTSYTTDTTDHIINCQNTSGTGTLAITLHSAADLPGQELIIKRMSTGIVTYQSGTSPLEFVDGSTSVQTLATQYHLAILVSNGTRWMRMHSGAP